VISSVIAVLHTALEGCGSGLTRDAQADILGVQTWYEIWGQTKVLESAECIRMHNKIRAKIRTTPVEFSTGYREMCYVVEHA